MLKITSTYTKLIDQIETKDFTIGIVGLGYVGLPLACEFINNGINVIGIDVSEEKIHSLKKKKSYIT